MRKYKTNPWAMFTAIATFVIAFSVIALSIVARTGVISLRGTPMRAIMIAGVLTFLFPYGYLLCSALSHFKKKWAITLWLGSILSAPAWCGVIFLLFQGETTIFTLLLISMPTFIMALVLLIAAIIKRDIRYGWGVAAFLMGFWSGIGIFNAAVGHWDVFLLNPIGNPLLLLILCAFIVFDMTFQYRLAASRKTKNSTT